MTKRILCLLAAAGIAAPQFVGAVNYLDWADEFISARITCENNACTTFGYFNGDGPTFVARPWWYIGRQGTDAQGRANARERSNFIFTDNATGTCSTQTLQLARYRTATPPAIGQPCSATAAFAASASYTIDSCQFANADKYYISSLNPVLDFAAETAVNATIGYRSVSTVTNSLGQTASSTNCFRIQWQ